MPGNPLPVLSSLALIGHLYLVVLKRLAIPVTLVVKNYAEHCTGKLYDENCLWMRGLPNQYEATVFRVRTLMPPPFTVYSLLCWIKRMPLTSRCMLDVDATLRGSMSRQTEHLSH